MAEQTNISWTNSTWNPVRGCERVSEGCRHCYAEELAARYSYKGGWGEGLAKWVDRPDGSREARWTGVLRPMDKLLDAPLHWKKPRRIFVNSMSDLFHEDVPADFIARVFATMAECPQHVFQILTKRPVRMLQLLKHDLNYDGPKWPLQNVWLGVSVEDQATAIERIPVLLNVPAAVRWISAEPLLGPVDLLWDRTWTIGRGGIRWVVIGAESGSGHRTMDMTHARSLIAQCTEAGVKRFVKQDNGPRPGMQGRFTDEEFSLKEFPA